jgi:hypothetical protein
LLLHLLHQVYSLPKLLMLSQTPIHGYHLHHQIHLIKSLIYNLLLSSTTIILPTHLVLRRTLLYNHALLISHSIHHQKNQNARQVINHLVNYYNFQQPTVSVFRILETTHLFIRNLDTSYPSSSTPIVAVRRVMNTLLSQRTQELEKINSQTKPLRGERLRNNTGLNITDDEFVFMKMTENEEKKHQKSKPRLSKRSNATSTSSSTTTTMTNVEVDLQRRILITINSFTQMILKLKLVFVLLNR